MGHEKIMPQEHKPDWLKIRPPTGQFSVLKEIIRKNNLPTVCQESHCPNMAECWSGGTATFMILGDTCTRGCKFCNVKTGYTKKEPDLEEPEHLATTAQSMKLDYVVITSVDRDDLPDGGSSHFAQCIHALKQLRSKPHVEVLIPDFKGNKEQIITIINAQPDAIAHNLETVRRLQQRVRDQRAGYEQSLNVLKFVKEINHRIYTKSSLMLGLGETEEELLQAFKDLRSAGVDILTLGQYLRPSDWHLPVEEYVHAEKFKYLEQEAKKLGFLHVAAGPFVRSSYKAGELFIKAQLTANPSTTSDTL